MRALLLAALFAILPRPAGRPGTGLISSAGYHDEPLITRVFGDGTRFSAELHPGDLVTVRVGGAPRSFRVAVIAGDDYLEADRDVRWLIGTWQPFVVRPASTAEPGERIPWWKRGP